MTGLRTVEIVAIGSELVTPSHIDTNSLFLTAQLNELGLLVQAKTIVEDDVGHVVAIVQAALRRADIVLITGGLGPTADDVTRDAVGQALGRPLHEDGEILRSIEDRFARRGITMPSVNRRQARVIQDADVVANAHGTAPGQIVRHGTQLVVLLPGPPRELEPMFRDRVAPVIRAFAGSDRRLRRRILKITGRSESQIEEIAQPLYSRLGEDGVAVETTILASPGQIELHLTAAGTDDAALDRVLERGRTQLTAALGPLVFSDDGRSLEHVVGDLLHERRWRIAVAESCTAGLVLARLTEISGSSAWVVGGVVAYANQIKVDELGVSAELIASQGAVSEPVAIAMADGVRLKMKTEIAVSVTGIAGPTGGSAAKPVGTVVVAVTGPRRAVRTFLFPGDRDVIRRHSTAAAIDMARRVLLDLPVDH